jgi:beta-mannanase
VWSPNAFNFATGKSRQFYPGDQYDDCIAVDGYNWAPGKAGASWNSFKNIFASYAWAAPKPQPLLIEEAGVQENHPGDKPAWITDMGTAIKTLYREIKAVVDFDAYATANFGGWYDFRVDTSAQLVRSVPNPGERSLLQLADVRGRRRCAHGPG